MKRIGYILYVFVFTAIALEIFLRIYNPFPAALIGDEIALKTNYQITFPNKAKLNGLDTQIVVTKNSLGFRGPELPRSSTVKILAVGGSTTECIFVNDGKTWPDVLRSRLNLSYGPVWINNAGLDGQSTYGHLFLLKQHILKLKPDVCIFLVGCNDVGRTDLNAYDSSLLNVRKSWKTRLAHHSRLFNLGLNLYRHHKAVGLNLVHKKNLSLADHASLVITDSVIKIKMDQEAAIVTHYAKRLQEIIALCRSNSIEPVFITQPFLLGEGNDDVTGADLATYRIADDLNGKLLWQKLELYNQETRHVANRNNVHLIDLARRLPKSTRYFYDLWHYNNAGCLKIGNVVADALIPFLQEKYSAK